MIKKTEHLREETKKFALFILGNKHEEEMHFVSSSEETSKPKS